MRNLSAAVVALLFIACSDGALRTENAALRRENDGLKKQLQVYRTSAAESEKTFADMKAENEKLRKSKDVALDLLRVSYGSKVPGYEALWRDQPTAAAVTVANRVAEDESAVAAPPRETEWQRMEREKREEWAEKARALETTTVYVHEGSFRGSEYHAAGCGALYSEETLPSGYTIRKNRGTPIVLKYARDQRMRPHKACGPPNHADY